MGTLRDGVGRRIRQLRKAAGLTQERLAGRANMDPKYLGSVERGEKSMSLEMIERIVRTLKVEPYEPFLFSLKDPRQQRKVDDDVLINMIRHAEPSARPFLVDLLQTALRWMHAKGK